MVFLGNGTGEPTATTTTTTTTAPSNTIPNLAVNTAYDGLTFTGQNLRYFALGDYQQCQATCQNDPNCRGWSWVKPGGYKAGDPPVCYLVSRIDSEVRHPCCISGLKGAAPPASNPAPSGGTGPLAGNWKYAAQCGYGGFGGQVTISQTADGRFTGIMTGQYAGQIVNGQQSQSHITFTLIVNGSPGNWSGDLSGNKISGHFPCGGGSGNFTLSR
jgi:hypothetical protein